MESIYFKALHYACMQVSHVFVSHLLDTRGTNFKDSAHKACPLNPPIPLPPKIIPEQFMASSRTSSRLTPVAKTSQPHKSLPQQLKDSSYTSCSPAVQNPPWFPSIPPTEPLSREVRPTPHPGHSHLGYRLQLGRNPLPRPQRSTSLPHPRSFSPTSLAGSTLHAGYRKPSTAQLAPIAAATLCANDNHKDLVG